LDDGSAIFNNYLIDSSALLIAGRVDRDLRDLTADGATGKAAAVGAEELLQDRIDRSGIDADTGVKTIES